MPDASHPTAPRATAFSRAVALACLVALAVFLFAPRGASADDAALELLVKCYGNLLRMWLDG